MKRLSSTCLAAVLAVSAVSLAPSSVRAAESLEGCVGFIDSLPATIATQGVWCLREDLSTAMASGNAISVDTNNVTIDCNGYKVGGLAAGEASTTRGIRAFNRQNTTVRNCALRGFYHGVELIGESGGGHLVEHNRFDQNLLRGIYIDGDNNLVRENRVFDTGGAPGVTTAWGMGGSADFIGNTISGGFVAGEETQFVYGILLSGPGSVRDNIVRGLLHSEGAAGQTTGIRVGGGASGAIIQHNHVTAAEPGFNGYGIWGNTVDSAICSGNIVSGFVGGIGECHDGGGNASH